MKKHTTSAISQMFGKFASKEFSPWFQNIVNNSYVKLMGLDMSEFNDPKSYKSLNALFTRRLKQERKFSLKAEDFISPCDSLITECGALDEEYALQIKGMQYKVSELLGDSYTKEEHQEVFGGSFINLYLSPKDYHRYHMPTNAKILKAVHIPGKFYPVNIPSLNKRVNLFIENERVVITCQTNNGKKFHMVLVSALNVGVMQVSFEPKIKTNSNTLKPQVYAYENLYLDKGDDFGCFEMGSTIVIIAEKDMLEIDVKTNEKVKYSQTIAHIN